jgi:NAD(P)-dependent dehydrogenase (short-subunit alcohol dehydrogenase family)
MNSVLISGASTGIGRSTALLLADNGMTVYAGVRKSGDAAELAEASTGDLRPIRLDVTKPAEIESAIERLADEGGLGALVNNAGVYIGGPLELLSEREIRTIFEVNVLGLLTLTRACLPLLRDSGGRIINVSSISGLVALPGAAVYAGSKFAVEAITDSLRTELSPFGIRVIAVEPGSIQTEIWTKGAERDRKLQAHADPVRELYAPLVRLLEKLNRDPRGIPPERVAEVVHTALTSDSPDNRYLVGTDARTLALLRLLPDFIRDGMIKRKVWPD